MSSCPAIATCATRVAASSRLKPACLHITLTLLVTSDAVLVVSVSAGNLRLCGGFVGGIDHVDQVLLTQPHQRRERLESDLGLASDPLQDATGQLAEIGFDVVASDELDNRLITRPVGPRGRPLSGPARHRPHRPLGQPTAGNLALGGKQGNSNGFRQQFDADDR